MKIICTVNTAKNLDLTEVTNILSHDTEFYLDIDKEYLVMGLAINKRSSCLYYLIDENEWPNWYPYPLFAISDPKIPNNWYIDVMKKSSPGTLHFLSGFYELVCNEDFYDDLMERERYAMEIYFKRKIEAEENDLL